MEKTEKAGEGGGIEGHEGGRERRKWQGGKDGVWIKEGGSVGILKGSHGYKWLQMGSDRFRWVQMAFLREKKKK